MSAPVTEQAILDALHQVPEGRWPEVLRAIESPRAPEAPIRTAAEMAASDLVGLWSDRDDLGSSAEFAARLRRDAENRLGTGDAR
jgi:hypothetical protein